MQGMIVVTGKGYGATNFIALDRSGEILVDRQIQVEGPSDRLVTVYRGIERESYSCMAGVAGALYVPQVGIINPSEFAPGNSIEAVIWVAVGGRGTLVGAALGAVVVNYAKTFFTSGVLAPYWLFMRWSRTGSRRQAASFRSVRPTASACW